jgi:hypothetical protein
MALGVERDRAQTIVAIEWVLFTICVIIIGVVCFAFRDDLAKAYDQDEDTAKIILVTGILTGVSLLIGLAINVTLTVGVNQEHSTCCKVWYVINIINIVLQSINLLLNLITLNLLALPVAVACLCYRVYAGKVIKAYMDAMSGIGGGIIYSVPPGHADNVGLMYPPPPYNHNKLTV